MLDSKIEFMPRSVPFQSLPSYGSRETTHETGKTGYIIT